MAQDRAFWQHVNLVVITRSNSDQEARARHCCTEALAAGLASAIHLSPTDLAALPEGRDLPPPLRADPRAAFRATVPAYLARRLAALPPEHILVIQIIEDHEDRPIFHADARMQTMLAQTGDEGLYGQALCWPHRHHVRTDCLVRMDADNETVTAAPYAPPSPAVFRPTGMAHYFLEDWSALARNPAVSLGLPDTLAPASPLLRRHEEAWAVGSVLAHLRGIPLISLDPQAAGEDASAAQLCEHRLTRGGLRLSEAAEWLESGGMARMGDAVTAVSFDRLRDQVNDLLARGEGRFCEDHIEALIDAYRHTDLLFFSLSNEDSDPFRRLRQNTCAQMNLAWAEHVLDGGCLRPEDLPDLMRHACLSALTCQDGLTSVLGGTMVWLCLGKAGRRSFRGFFGPLISSEGRAAMKRFVLGLSGSELAGLLAIRNPDSPEGRDMAQRMADWITVGG